MKVKAYINYYRGRRIGFIPLMGQNGIEPDEIEIYLQPYCKLTENEYGEPAVLYKGTLYFDSNIFCKGKLVCIREYRSGDDVGYPSGRIVTIGQVLDN